MSKAVEWVFYPINSPRAHEEVTEQIILAISAGAFRPGERLPHLESLAHMMRVSRPVVGEALKTLKKAGVVATQRGVNGGLTVLTTAIPSDIMAQTAPLRNLSLQAIIEARRPIELALARTMAQRASDEDFTSLQRCIDQLKKHKDSPVEDRIRYDHLFHYNMGHAARSPALLIYQHQVLEQIFLRQKEYFIHTEDVDEVIALHEETLEALRTRDFKAIEIAIDRHLSPLEKVILGDRSATPEMDPAVRTV